MLLLYTVALFPSTASCKSLESDPVPPYSVPVDRFMTSWREEWELEGNKDLHNSAYSIRMEFFIIITKCTFVYTMCF